MLDIYRATVGGHTVECRQAYPGVKVVSLDGTTLAREDFDEDAFRIFDIVKSVLQLTTGSEPEEAGCDDYEKLFSMSLGREGDMYAVTAKSYYPDKREAEHAFRAVSVSMREVQR